VAERTQEPPGSRREPIQAAFARSKMGVADLWLSYFHFGGLVGPAEFAAYLEGAVDLDEAQRDLVAVAVDERLDELAWRRRVPRGGGIGGGPPEAGPLTALVELMRGGYLAPPDSLPFALDRAAEALNVRAFLYLIDYEETELVPFHGPDGGSARPLSLDGTIPGRAFRSLKTLTAANDGHGRLWVPVIDGMERIGVLDVRVAKPEDLHDARLREQCWWLAHLAAHLVTAIGRTGDAVDAVRRTRPRSVAAELIWQLLPPLTAATDKVVVSGRLEPASNVGGDVFDYALSEHHAHLAIIDATGHDLAAGLGSAAALAAYRNARREGRSLSDQARAISEVMTRQFGGETFATGVVARLDLSTGRLRYVLAGHPSPLILRDGRVVKVLDGGRRPLFGLPAPRTSVGEEQLQPGDSIVLYTDGITESRDDRGDPFGLAGLTDFLERESGTDAPLPEVVRRLTHAIVSHQGGVLKDDATILVAEWTNGRGSGLEPEHLR
jgi:serine phosphatase RsbU (regulator of sigma subunit)